MQYIEGEPLSTRLARGPVSSREAASFAQQITAAVGAAHQHGVLHRDLKPQNVFLQQDGSHLVVGDFGLAKLQMADSQHTSADEILGNSGVYGTGTGPRFLQRKRSSPTSGRLVRRFITC